jgi:alkanesulfonate monooxygenase SsuD/methylene tetrahydromethanopterin reductase-like flavin-dependent oxidoreductase (luciferase family)
MALKHGIILPGGTASEQLEQAVLAEQAGWDGVFVWETAYGVDPWGLLCAMAARTDRVRLGTMLTPLPWRRPWKVASQVATLDQLSAGRAVLAVGVGAVTTDLPVTGEPTDLRHRAELMDEGIDLIRTLWQGGRRFDGNHYHYLSERDELAEVVRPVQERIPIWVVAVWPRPKSMRRALRCDGVIPGNTPTPESIREMRAWLAAQGAPPTIDVLTEGETPTDDPTRAADLVAPWAEAGCTWWMETRWEIPHNADERMTEVRARITAGPPRS